MIARWIIKTTGELMAVKVTKNHQAFEKLINSHPQMFFIEWD